MSVSDDDRRDSVVVIGRADRQGGAVARHLLANGRAVRLWADAPGSPEALELERLGAVLVTGASGFVGRSLCPALQAAGYSVRGLTRDAARARSKWPGLMASHPFSSVIVPRWTNQ